MVALFVIATIVAFLVADAILLYVRKHRNTTKENEDIHIICGKPCLCDGGTEVKEIKENKDVK